MIFQDDGLVTVETAAEVMAPPPAKYSYTLEDFQGVAPYEKMYSYMYDRFRFKQEAEKMAINATEVGFRGFRSMLKAYVDTCKQNERQSIAPNITEFDTPYGELYCGEWTATDFGIYRESSFGGREYACAHAIMPVERLVNIDTAEVKLKLAYKRPGRDKKWQTTIVGKDVVSTSKTIVQLATQGISVTSTSAKSLVDFLNDIENDNYDRIPESKSIGRLGYIPGEGFSPYVDGLVFDGDASFKNLYGCVKSKGSVITWCDIAEECRKMSVTARILLAASFASPILSIVGSLPFFVHLWGVDSGTGKTVALMLAASVWGDPALGSYVQTFNSTQVGQERTAAFLNHLPFCIDELQLTKDSKGRSNFDVYQLAQGVGRARGRKNGGIDAAPTWSCCFLTTGESPIVSGSAGAGAVNRVIDIECTAGSAVITEGQRIANALKQNYGHVGRTFVEKIYSSDEWLDTIRDLYQDFYKELCSGDSTEKQAMAAAAILTADTVATQLFFKDGMALTVKDIRDFLASKEAVSAGNRAYNWLCDWVAANVNHFNSDQSAAQGETYGVLEGDMAYIIRGVFDRVIQEAGFSASATLSYLRNNRLIEVRPGKGKGYTKTKRIGGTTPQCIWLRLNGSDDIGEEDMLPL